MPLFGPPNVAQLADRGDEKGLIRALRHKDPQIRASAAKALQVVASPAAVDALRAALDDPAEAVREAVVPALERLRAVVPLVQALDDESSDVRRSAAASLGRLRDPRALAPLIDALHDESPFVRGVAAVQLGTQGDQRAVVALAGVLSDPYPSVRFDAVRGLAMLAGPHAAEVLTAALGDEDRDVRKCAVDALEERGALPEARVWLGLLQRDGVGLDAREEAASMLRFSSDERCRADIRDPLVAIIDDDELDDDTRSWALTELAQLHDPRAIEPLLADLGGGRGDRWMTLVALDRLGALDEQRWLAMLDEAGDTSARIEVLDEVQALGRTLRPPRRFLDDEDAEMRTAAVHALARDAREKADDSSEVVEPLVRALRDESSDVRAAGRDALVAITPARAVDPLIDLLGDPRPQLRREAYGALRALDDPRAIAARQRVNAPRVGDHVRIDLTELMEAGMPGDTAYLTTSRGGWTGTVVSVSPEVGTVAIRRDAVHGECGLPVGEVTEMPIEVLASTEVSWPDGDEPRRYEIER